MGRAYCTDLAQLAGELPSTGLANALGLDKRGWLTDNIPALFESLSEVRFHQGEPTETFRWPREWSPKIGVEQGELRVRT
jgi:hypothetical protein